MKRLICIVTLIVTVITACTEKTDIKLDSTYTRLVVDGQVSNDTTLYRINLTKTSDYFSNEPAPRVSNASVIITDGKSEYRLHETIPGNSGLYETDSSFKGKAGETYTLTIDLPEKLNNQTHYLSTCKMMHVARLDSIAVDFQPDWGNKGIWEIKLWAQDPGDENNYYMFHYYRNDTLKTDSIWKISLSDDQFFNGNYIHGITCLYIDNEKSWETIHPGDRITLQMSGITKEYYDFVSQVQMAGYNIPFFSGPPANVVGNINNGAIGFFSAYSDTWGHTVVK